MKKPISTQLKASCLGPRLRRHDDGDDDAFEGGEQGKQKYTVGSRRKEGGLLAQDGVVRMQDQCRAFPPPINAHQKPGGIY